MVRANRDDVQAPIEDSSFGFRGSAMPDELSDSIAQAENDYVCDHSEDFIARLRDCAAQDHFNSYQTTVRSILNEVQGAADPIVKKWMRGNQ